MYEYGDINENTLSPIQDKISEIRELDRNYNKAIKDQYLYKGKDVGIKNNNGSRLRIDENNNIEMLSAGNAGILINDLYKTTNLYGSAVNINASLIRMNTEHNGLMWNNHYLNPMLYQLSGPNQLRLIAEVISPTTGLAETYKIAPFIEASEDVEFRRHLDNLGIK